MTISDSIFSSFCSGAFDSAKNAARILEPYASETWNAVKNGIKILEPHQPAIAGGLILAKLAWRIYKQQPLQREIDKIDHEIKRYSAVLLYLSKSAKNIQKLRNDRPPSPEEILLLRRIKKIEISRADVQVELEEKKRQMSYAALTFGQLPSLFFDHPGSNMYQTIHHIVGRWMQIQHVARPIRPIQATMGSRIKNALILAGGIISMAGTAASFCRMTRIVAADNRMSHIFSMLAIGVHALEGIIMGVSTFNNCRQTLTKYVQENPSVKKRLQKISCLVERAIMISGGAAIVGQMTGFVRSDNTCAQILSGIALGLSALRATQKCVQAMKIGIQRSKKYLMRQNHAH